MHTPLERQSMMHGTKNSTGEPKCYSCGCSYCNSPLMQCSASTAHSLMFAELYRCIKNSNSVCDTRRTLFSQDKFSGSEITPCGSPGAAFERISLFQVTSETTLSVQSVSDSVSPSGHSLLKFKKSCVFAVMGQRPALSLVVARCVRKHVLQSVSFSQEETHFLVPPVDCGNVLQ